MIADDTIAAIATGSGAAGVGIVRLSGPDALRIAQSMTASSPEPRRAIFVKIRDSNGEELDQALLLYFPAPHSFTGEHVAELQCHGGPIVLRSVLRECIKHGARQAAPGEFSQRAFLNGKIDLIQAEAIADLIHSGSEAAARSASRSLSGTFSTQVDALFEHLVRLRVFIEAAIDFPEEELDFIADSDVLEQLVDIQCTLHTLLESAKRGRTLRDGLKIVIVGAPNAGKSSLLNQLSEHDSAIVTDIPGTTRDVLREHIQLDGLPLHIVDTAGLREAPDAVEQEGIRRAHSEMQTADHVLLVVDSATLEGQKPALALVDEHRSKLPGGARISVLRNKSDLQKRLPELRQHGDIWELFLSAKDGSGLDLLRQHLRESAGLNAEESSEFSARERHVRALEICQGHLEQGHSQLRDHGAAELIAEDLRYAQEALGKITGRFSSDALLGEIFSSFCIGK